MPPDDRNGGDRSPVDESHAHCPACETPIVLVTTVGPSEHYVSPCGHRIPSGHVRPEE